jgi:MFS family permease
MAAPLALGEFRALWAAEAVSIAGDQLAKVALALLVFQRTGSALASAAVYALSFLPALAGGLGLAQLADRYPRRTVLVTGALIQAGCVGAMAIPGMPLTAMCVLLVCSGVAQAPALSAQNALTRDVIDDDGLYYRSQDLRGVTTNTVMLLGLAGAGLLVSQVGTSTALLVDALTFAAAALLVRHQVAPRPAAGGAGAGTSWHTGLTHIWRTRWLRSLLALSWLVGFAVVPEGLAAPLAAQLHAPSGAVGWLLAADPLGYVVGTFALSHYCTVEARQRLVGWFAIGSVLVLVGFAAVPALPFALLLLALAGAIGAYQVTVGATMTSWVPTEVRGGVFGVARTGLRVSQGVGVALGGVLAQAIGSAAHAIAIAGGVGVLIAVPATVAWTRRYRSDGLPGHNGTTGRTAV